MRLLLTGGTGFFGKALLRHHLSLSVPVFSKITVLTRNPKSFLSSYPEFNAHNSVQFLCADVLSPDTLPWQDKFTHVIHAASQSTLGPKLSPLERYHSIVGELKIYLNWLCHLVHLGSYSQAQALSMVRSPLILMQYLRLGTVIFSQMTLGLHMVKPSVLQSICVSFILTITVLT